MYDILAQKIFKASVGTQKIYFTAYWLCQQQQGDKSHHPQHSSYICKTGRRTALAMQRNWTITVVITHSPLSPWLLIPALRSLAIWANSLSFSSFFSFSFWAIFFSTWALISTASLACGSGYMNLRRIVLQIKNKYKIYIPHKHNGLPFCQQCKEPQPAWQSFHWCGPFVVPYHQQQDVYQAEWCNPEKMLCTLGERETYGEG